LSPLFKKCYQKKLLVIRWGLKNGCAAACENLSKRLGDQGHQACTHTVARLLRKMGYSLQVAKKKQAGLHHPDRDEQFKYIAALKAQFLGENLPVISIDTKKKELILPTGRKNLAQGASRGRLLLCELCPMRCGPIWNL
jgi:hypothetical protein